MKHVLLFEDDPGTVESIKRAAVDSDLDFTVVASLPNEVSDPEFQDLLKRADEFDAIVFDHSMPTSDRLGLKSTMDGFIQAFAACYKKPMIAFASFNEMRQAQVKKGCTEALFTKDVALLVSRLEVLPH